PATYTLSLHDALPICTQSLSFPPGSEAVNARMRELGEKASEAFWPSRPVFGGSVRLLLRIRPGKGACSHQPRPANAAARIAAAGDRKSTRLNSSHVAI